MLDITYPKSPQKTYFMSLKLLINDQINRLFKENPELEIVNKDKFEIAVANFVNLKYLNGISTDDLIDGITGAGGDEGIDLCYIFCNSIPVTNENHPIKADSTIKVKFFQVKYEDSFAVKAFNDIKEGIEEIFNLELDLKKLKHIGANTAIIEKADLIRQIFRRTQIERATFLCEVFYVTVSPDHNIPTKVKFYEEEMVKNPLSIPFRFHYLNGQNLLDLNKKIEEKLDIKFNLQYLEAFEKGVDTKGFAGFVKANDLMASLIDEEGNFKSHLTEGNVRFFLGEDKKINQSIINSARDKTKAVIFWAMNNGITILGDSILPIGSQTYSITNPQIVNGCQTVHCLNLVYKEQNSQLTEGLKVFVKLVQTDNVNTQTDIISATNSQNSVKSASLKANDDIQKNLEIHLKKYGIYYERRENYYKRQNYTGNKVIGLLKMAQIIHTVVNKEANVAINDTATLFDTSAKYNMIFHEKADYELYYFSVRLYQHIWKLKNSDLRNNEYEPDERELISKGGFIFLHIISSLLFSEAEFLELGHKVKRKITGKISIKVPARKNEFAKRKGWLLKAINDENILEREYHEAKKIFNLAATSYSDTLKKNKLSLFKNRHFDEQFLIPAINKYFEKGKIK